MKTNTLSTAFTAVLLALASQTAWSGSWNPTSSDANGNTAGGSSALSSVTGTYNTGFGYGSLNKTTSGYYNTGFGVYSLLNNTIGYGNTAVGIQSLNSNTSGNYNTATGIYALYGNTTGIYNIGVGYKALTNSTTGTYNTAIGYSAGSNQTTGSYNIYLGNSGVAAESYVTRIGNSQTATYVSGIYTKSTDDSASSTLVYVDKNGKLGTLMSSQRYKENVQDMKETSQGLYALRPVTYNYKQDVAKASKSLEYGLIAEEVAKVYPDLVIRNDKGEIETVQYHKLTPMLLNEMQRLNNALQAEKAKNIALADTLKTEQEQNKLQTQEIAQLKQQVTQVMAQAQQLQSLALKLSALAPALKQPLQLVNNANNDN